MERGWEVLRTREFCGCFVSVKQGECEKGKKKEDESLLERSCLKNQQVPAVNFWENRHDDEATTECRISCGLLQAALQ